MDENSNNNATHNDMHRLSSNIPASQNDSDISMADVEGGSQPLEPINEESLKKRKQEDFSYEKAKEHLDYKKALEALSRCVDYAKKARQCLGALEWITHSLGVLELRARIRSVDYAFPWALLHVIAKTKRNERFSERVNKFWMTINEGLTNDKIKTEENEYDLTLTTNVNKQMGTYVNATTTRLTKRFLECAKESPPKRVAKNLMEDDHNNPLIVSGTFDELVVSGTSDGNDSDKSYHPKSTIPGIKKSSLSEGAKKWVIDTLDVSSLLLEYRDMSVQRASENKIEEVAEILSLNHIFLFEQNVTNGISSMIEPESLNIIFDTIKNEFAPYHLSNDDVLRCYKMAKTACEDFGKCKSLLRKWQKDLDDDQEDLILETFESIINNFKPEVYRSTDVLEASVHRKRKFDPILQGRKADFSVYMPIRDCDFVKLGNEMKDIIDKCIDDGVKNNDLIICGLLVEGFQCRLFAMDLKYEAIYRMILLGKFYLPRDSSDLGVLPTSIERLMQMKTIMTCSAEICKKKIQNLSKRETIQGNVTLINEMTRPSFHTPIKVPQKKLV
ncbi:hypothetical protein Glove_74g86 [Diversispora epigaea]|uniref:Uncharacterized protein n=1 Tax=Diversispora epigaea TaxID=1348612 RepID=A0A397JBD8_9GLOM|nr:hypothetical protein Glove_74g86 [Diversispora epigaea]